MIIKNEKGQIMQPIMVRVKMIQTEDIPVALTEDQGFEDAVEWLKTAGIGWGNPKTQYHYSNPEESSVDFPHVPAPKTDLPGEGGDAIRQEESADAAEDGITPMKPAHNAAPTVQPSGAAQPIDKERDFEFKPEKRKRGRPKKT